MKFGCDTGDALWSMYSWSVTLWFKWKRKWLDPGRWWTVIMVSQENFNDMINYAFCRSSEDIIWLPGWWSQHYDFQRYATMYFLPKKIPLRNQFCFPTWTIYLCTICIHLCYHLLVFNQCQTQLAQCRPPHFGDPSLPEGMRQTLIAVQKSPGTLSEHKLWSIFCQCTQTVCSVNGWGRKMIFRVDISGRQTDSTLKACSMIYLHFYSFKSTNNQLSVRVLAKQVLKTLYCLNGGISIWRTLHSYHSLARSPNHIEFIAQ